LVIFIFNKLLIAAAAFTHYISNIIYFIQANIVYENTFVNKYTISFSFAFLDSIQTIFHITQNTGEPHIPLTVQNSSMGVKSNMRIVFRHFIAFHGYIALIAIHTAIT